MGSYDTAREVFASWGVDTEVALARLSKIPISVHCWQGDDVVGFEKKSGTSGGGIQATGNYPGRARNPAELRADLDFAYSKIPGKHRLNLHAFYMDTTEKPRPRRDRVQALRTLGRLGQGRRYRHRFQPDLFCPTPRPTTT